MRTSPRLTLLVLADRNRNRNASLPPQPQGVAVQIRYVERSIEILPHHPLMPYFEKHASRFWSNACFRWNTLGTVIRCTASLFYKITTKLPWISPYCGKTFLEQMFSRVKLLIFNWFPLGDPWQSKGETARTVPRLMDHAEESDRPPYALSRLGREMPQPDKESMCDRMPIYYRSSLSLDFCHFVAVPAGSKVRHSAAIFKGRAIITS